MRDLLRERKKRDQETGARIRAILLRRGMTQRELAKQVGLVDSTISHYILGDTHIQPATLKGIADALGVTVEELTEG